MAIRNGLRAGSSQMSPDLEVHRLQRRQRKQSGQLSRLISMTGTFIDSLIICTLTGLTLMVLSVWQMSDVATGALTETAFNTVYQRLEDFH